MGEETATDVVVNRPGGPNPCVPFDDLRHRQEDGRTRRAHEVSLATSTIGSPREAQTPSPGRPFRPASTVVVGRGAYGAMLQARGRWRGKRVDAAWGSTLAPVFEVTDTTATWVPERDLARADPLATTSTAPRVADHDFDPLRRRGHGSHAPPTSWSEAIWAAPAVLRCSGSGSEDLPGGPARSLRLGRTTARRARAARGRGRTTRRRCTYGARRGRGKPADLSLNLNTSVLPGTRRTGTAGPTSGDSLGGDCSLLKLDWPKLNRSVLPGTRRTGSERPRAAGAQAAWEGLLLPSRRLEPRRASHTSGRC